MPDCPPLKLFRLTQETNVCENCLSWTFAVAKVDGFMLIAITVLMKTDQKLEDIIPAGYTQIALISFITVWACGRRKECYLSQNLNQFNLLLTCGFVSFVASRDNVCNSVPNASPQMNQFPLMPRFCFHPQCKQLVMGLPVIPVRWK